MMPKHDTIEYQPDDTEYASVPSHVKFIEDELFDAYYGDVPQGA